MTRITGRTALLLFISTHRLAQGLSEAELLRRAGLSRNLLANMRKDHRRGIYFETALALFNALGFDFTDTPLE